MPDVQHRSHKMQYDEHRSHQRLQQYWESLRGDRAYPNESEIDPDEIEELWPSCFLVAIDAVTHTMGYRYSYLGREMVEAYGEDLDSPDIVGKLVSTDTGTMVKKFDEVIKTGKPVVDESSFVNLKHLNIRYRTCMLPLGGPGGGVVYILGCMRWKAY